MRQKRIILSTVIFTLFLSAIAMSQEKKPLTNADVIKMIQAGLPENTIVLAIQQNPSNFDTTPEALIQLKNQGATQRIMEAVLQPKASQAPPASVGVNPGAVETIPKGVTLIDGANRSQMKRSQPNSRGDIGGVAGVLNPFGKAKSKDAFDGNHAKLRLTNNVPVFELALPEDVYPSDHIAIVKLEVKSSRREIETGRAGITDISSGFRKKDIVPVTFEEVQTQNAGGIRYKLYRVKLVNPLAAGEYALVAEGGYYDFGIDVGR